MQIVTRIILNWAIAGHDGLDILEERFRKNNYIEFASWFQYTYAFFKFREKRVRPQWMWSTSPKSAGKLDDLTRRLRRVEVGHRKSKNEVKGRHQARKGRGRESPQGKSGEQVCTQDGKKNAAKSGDQNGKENCPQTRTQTRAETRTQARAEART